MDKKRTINIAEQIVGNFTTEEVVDFLDQKLRQYNQREEKADPELAIYISVLTALNKKLGGGKVHIVL